MIRNIARARTHARTRAYTRTHTHTQLIYSRIMYHFLHSLKAFEQFYEIWGAHPVTFEDTIAPLNSGRLYADLSRFEGLLNRYKKKQFDPSTSK